MTCFCSAEFDPVPGRKSGLAPSLTELAMNHASNHSQRPTRNILWQAPPRPAQGEHRHEVIAHELGGALKRCVRRGSQEAV